MSTLSISMIADPTHPVQSAKSGFPHLEHPSFRAAYEALDTLVRDSLDGGAELVPIIGPSRVGKTYLVDRAKAALEPTELSHLRETRILHVRVPAIRSLKELLSAILDAMGLGHLTKGTTGDLESRVHRQLEKLGTRVLVLDEIQHLGEFGDNAKRRVAADMLKVLYDRLHISIVFMGLPRGLQLVDSNEQLRARSNAPVVIRPYYSGRTADANAFANTVLAVEKWIRDNGGHIEIEFDVMVRGAYYATGGCIGMLEKLFGPFGRRADAVVNRETLAQQYRKAFFRNEAPFNPFLGEAVDNDILDLVHQNLMEQSGLPAEIDSNYAMADAAGVA